MMGSNPPGNAVEVDGILAVILLPPIIDGEDIHAHRGGGIDQVRALCRD